MRKIVVTEFVSLDGVMEDPGGAEGYQYGGWTIPYWNDELGAFKTEELLASDALLLGRVTYQAFAAAWPQWQRHLDLYGPILPRLARCGR